MWPKIIGLRYKNTEPESCSVSTGGGMLGGYRTSRLKKEKNGEVTLTVSGKEHHAAREVTTVYRVSPEALSKVNEIAYEYGLYAASMRPRSRIEVLDGDTTTVSFDYPKGDFRISDEQVLSKKMRQGFREVMNYLSSLAAGEGVTTREPQRGLLYLKSGYTLQFIVDDLFDGRVEKILGEERETSRYEDCGITICTGEEIDLSGAEPVNEAAGGWIVYDSRNKSVIILHQDHVFEQPVYRLAVLDGHIKYAAELIAEMEGSYRLIFLDEGQE